MELTKDHELNKMDMSCIVREDLGMKSCALAKVQLLMANQRQKRLECCKKILNFLKRGDDKVLVFSDEKIFTIDAVGNSRTKWYIAKKPEDVPAEIHYHGHSKHPAASMMLGIVSGNRKAFPPVWINGTLDANKYKRILVHKVFPMLDTTYGARNWV